MDEHEWLAEQFEANRAHLRAVAYRMLGSLSEADDAVQEAWLRLSRSDANGIENLGGWLTTVVARVSPGHAALAQARREEPLDAHVPDPIVEQRRRDRPRARSAAGRLGRARVARGARNADSRRAARVRAARHVRRALRRDRADRRALPDRGPAARQPRAAARAGREHRCRTRTSRASARSSTRFSPRRAAATSSALVAVLDPDVVLRGDCRAGAVRVVRGAEAVARRALATPGSGRTCGRRSSTASPGWSRLPTASRSRSWCLHGPRREDRRDRHPRRPRAAQRTRPQSHRRIVVTFSIASQRLRPRLRVQGRRLRRATATNASDKPTSVRQRAIEARPVPASVARRQRPTRRPPAASLVLAPAGSGGVTSRRAMRASVKGADPVALTGPAGLTRVDEVACCRGCSDAGDRALWQREHVAAVCACAR